MKAFLINALIGIAAAFLSVAFAVWSIDPSGWERIDRQMFLFIASVVAWLRYACGLIRRQA